MEFFNQSYNLLYFLICFITILFTSYNDFTKKIKDYKLGLIFVIIFLTFYFFLFGTRDYSIGTDTMSYKLIWDITKNFKLTTEFFTDGIIYFLKALNYDYRSFLYFFSLFFLGPLYLSIKKLSIDNKINPIYILFSFVSLFFFKSMGINIVRQGVSLSFFILFLSYFNYNSLKKNNILTFLFALIAIMIHNTTIIPIIIVVVVVTTFNNIKLKHLYFIYIISCIASYFKLGIHYLLSNFSVLDERRINMYVVTEDDFYTIGFKPQFVLFNTFFLLVFIFVRKFSLNDEKYNILLKYYIVTSSLFYLTFQMPYSDRWGIMSWIVIPFLLIPIFKNNFKIKSFKTITCLILVLIYSFFSIYFNQ